MEIEIRAEGVVLPATLTVPAGPVRGGVIPLHSAEAGHRSYFLYEHLSRVLPALGVALLRYDRRRAEDDGDVPFSSQASDAVAAVRVLREYVGEHPVGLWGFSQGGWAAPVAAASNRDITVVRLAGCDHLPTLEYRADVDGISEQYTRFMSEWLEHHLDVA